MFLTDDTDAVILFIYNSYKAKGVTPSAMAGKFIASCDLFDSAATKSDELSGILGRLIPIQLLADSKSPFSTISKASYAAETRMMLGIAAGLKGFGNKTISDIRLVRSNDNVAAGITSHMHRRSLQRLLTEVMLNIKL